MAITISTPARNAAVNAVAALVDGGASNGVLAIQDGATDLVVLPMSDPAFGAASTGSADAAAITQTNATAAGTADSFEVRDSDGTVIYSGSVTLTGGGGDITLTNLSINIGDPISISSATLSIPAS